MTPLQFQRIEELFSAASARPDCERCAYLDAHCEDSELRAAVDKLPDVLGSDETPFLDRVPQAAGEMGDLLSDAGHIPPVGQMPGPCGLSPGGRRAACIAGNTMSTIGLFEGPQ